MKRTMSVVGLLFCGCGSASAPALEAELGTIDLSGCVVEPCRFRPKTTLVLEDVPGRVIGVADLSGDDRPDIVFSDGPRLTVFEGRPDGTFAPPASAAALQGRLTSSVVDLDGDGRSEIVTVSDSLGAAFLFRYERGGHWSLEPLGAHTGALQHVDDDGRLDWVDLARDGYTSSTLSVTLARDGRSAAPAWSLTRPGSCTLLSGRSAGLTCGSTIALVQLGATGFSVRDVEPFPLEDHARESVVGADLNGDAALDFVLVPFLGSNMTVALASGDTWLRSTFANDRQGAPKVADVTGDGTRELVAAVKGTTTTDLQIIYAGTRVERFRTNQWEFPASVQVADLDRDGSAELLLFNDVRLTIFGASK